MTFLYIVLVILALFFPLWILGTAIVDAQEAAAIRELEKIIARKKIQDEISREADARLHNWLQATYGSKA